MYSNLRSFYSLIILLSSILLSSNLHTSFVIGNHLSPFIKFFPILGGIFVTDAYMVQKQVDIIACGFFFLLFIGYLLVIS